MAGAADTLEALGLDLRNVLSVSIKLSADIPVVEVTYALGADAGEKLADTLRRYVLADIPDTQGDIRR